MRKKNVIIIGIMTALVLMVPLVAMQFTGDVQWSPLDFVTMGALIFGTGLTYELIASRGGSRSYRAGVGVACAAGFLLIWVNLAVGLIGSEENPANALYFGVISIALIGVAVSRLQPRGLTIAMFATAAAAQAVVPVVALILWRTDFAPGVVQVFGLNTVFVALWIVSASLFRHSASIDPKWNRQLG